MQPSILSIVSAVLVLSVAAGPHAYGRESVKADFFVAPDGDDSASGARNKPFATLTRARDAVRALLASGAKRDITVMIRGGQYCLKETLVFTAADSAPDGHTITYTAVPGEIPILSAGVPVTDWRREENKLWSAPLPEGVGRIKSLYEGDKRLTRARGPGFKPTVKAKHWFNADQYSLPFPKGAIQRWPNLQDAELIIIPAAPWTMNILPLASVNEEKSVARMTARGTYGLEAPVFGHYKESAWIENMPAFINKPGEWAVDTREQRIYLRPRGVRPGDKLYAPAVTELIRIEGGIDYEGLQDRPVCGLVFKGLTFTHGDRYTRTDNRVGWGLQHDWEMFDSPTAMIRLRGAEGCAVENCTLTNAGASGIRLDLHCQKNRIAGNHLNHLGGVGILLAGYGPGIKDVNRNNQVLRNHIHHIGRDYWHSPAIFVWQSGHNRLANNLIHNTGYSGIVVSGRIVWDKRGLQDCARTVRWHEIRQATGREAHPGGWDKREPFLHSRKNVIERNEIHHIMEIMSDGNGVYVSGAGTGNMVRENFIHNCVSKHFAEGIRCDDDQYDTTIERNILWRLSGLATYVTIKGRNHVIGNIFAEPLQAPRRGMLSLELIKGARIDASRIEKNIFYTTRKGDKVVFQGRTWAGITTRLSDASTDRNLYWNTADPEWGRRHLDVEQKRGSEKNSIAADPLFLDPAKGNFALKADSPALKLGFEPIDMSVIGLHPGTARPSD